MHNNSFSRILTLLLVLGLVFSTATQLRLVGLPLGAGELMLLGWLAWIWVATFAHGIRRPNDTKVLFFFGLFWLVSLSCMLVGSWIGQRAGVSNLSGQMHDVLAYAFSLIICVSLAWLAPPRSESVRRIVWVGCSSMLVGSLLWVAAHGGTTLGLLHLWYGDLIGVRFLGWATNPNQMALLLLLSPFIGLYWLQQERKSQPSIRVLIVSLTAVATAAGWATDSGALRGAWLLAILMLVLFYMIGLFRGCRRAANALRQIMLIVFLAIGLLSLAQLQEKRQLLKLINDSATSMHLQKDEISAVEYAKSILALPQQSEPTSIAPKGDVSVRKVLLRHGFEALGHSPIFGFGPGAFSGLDRAFQGSEAHNSLLDWATNAGIVGAFALLALVAWLAYRLWLGKQWPLLAGLVAIVVFAQAHHVLRHPLLWAWLVLMSQVVRPASACSASEKI